jgi:hypothetical protein
MALELLETAYELTRIDAARNAIVRAAETILTYETGTPAPEVHPGYEHIEIDGIDCEIGWIETNDDSFFNVIRHGCEIGKGYTRERAIDDAYESLTAPGTWLRGPAPAHFGA